MLTHIVNNFSLLLLGLFFLIPNLTLAIPKVKLSDLDDLSFGTWRGESEVSRKDKLCVHKSANGDEYLVSAFGSGAGGKFDLNAGSDTLSYKVYWENDGGQAQQLKPNKLTRVRGADEDSPECDGLLNASVEVAFAELNLEAAPPGRYNGILTLTIEPV